MTKQLLRLREYLKAIEMFNSKTCVQIKVCYVSLPPPLTSCSWPRSLWPPVWPPLTRLPRLLLELEDTAWVLALGRLGCSPTLLWISSLRTSYLITFDQLLAVKIPWWDDSECWCLFLIADAARTLSERHRSGQNGNFMSMPVKWIKHTEQM